MIKVLIAEDDFRVASIHEEFILKMKDIEIVGKALNAKDTIRLLEKYDVDLLLLDIYMPDELGTELLPNIRKIFPKVDVIMITAATDKTLLEKAVRNGVYNYLIKPVTLDRFIETIESYKAKKKLLESQREVNQSLIDNFFGNVKKESVGEKILPKGIDPLTLQKIKKILYTLEDGTTADEMGQKMGASRTTARRYLEYLVSDEGAKAELEYGVVGRPERKYYPFD
ncbi:response regulator [Virgibacillus necropolis]|uniref:response regulator n=1 Tax=Virgibacillus necropolis TaxID=163877 RepID=UPI00384F06E6